MFPTEEVKALRQFWLLLIGAALFTNTPTAKAAMTEELKELKTKWPQHYFATAALTLGETHYQDLGKPAQKTVVMVHGVSGPMTAWDETVPFLRSLGYRTIRYDLYGRGFSERLDARHDLELYITQLKDLLDDRKVEFPVILLGSSFGCVIASEFANRYGKNLVKGLVLIGPAGTPIEVPFVAKLRDVPVLGQLLFWVVGKSTIKTQNEKYFVDETKKDSHMPYYEDQLDVDGSATAILSTMRNSPVQNYVAEFQNLGRSEIPVGVIWGRKDVTFPYDNHKTLQQAIPQMKLTTIDNSAHLPQFERPVQTNAALQLFLDQLP